MNWESIYLTCFITGLLLTAASFVFGSHFHLPVHLHLPAGLHLPAIHGHARADGPSPLNLTVLLMFLTWFGGAGYLMTHSHNSSAAVALPVAGAAGLTGGTLMYLFMARVFMANEHPLRDEDFEMVGVIGRVSSSIREETGTGELIYTQQGTRRSCGARSDDGRAIERGAEVVVMNYEKGIAYVRRFDDLHGQA